MVFNVCVKFHENMSSGFKVMVLTRKLLTDTHTGVHTHTEKMKTLYRHGILHMPGDNEIWVKTVPQSVHKIFLRSDIVTYTVFDPT